MGKGYKRKTRWRTLNIGAPPGEEDEEDGIRSSYAKTVENGTCARNGQPGHKSGRTDSAGSTTSDYASDYASAASRSRRDDSGGSPSQPKIIFNENEYTRITTPRQDVLFKKGYLSRKKVWASTASTSATPSTTESQSASHSTADGSETTEDQRLLDCKENGAEEYRAMAEQNAQVAYGTFYDHASGYYYEYPVMVVGPGGGMPGPPMHNVLTAVPCGPVPLRPIEWVNPAFVPKFGNQQYCVMDYQTTHLGQYPTLVDESGMPLTAPPENTNGCEETCLENGTGSASWSGSVADEEANGDEQPTQTDAQNGGTEYNSGSVQADGEEETPEIAVNSELYLENALAQQLHVTHVAAPPVPQPYMYPGHYMFGPSLVNVNGVTIQSGPMVRNTGVTGGPANTGACAKRRKKKKLSKRKSRRPVGSGNAEDEEQEEEEYSSESENAAAALSQTAVVGEAGTAASAVAVPVAAEKTAVTSSSTARRPLNPECKEFRPTVESRTVPSSVDGTSTEASTSLSNSDPSPITESENRHRVENAETSAEANVREPTQSRVAESATTPPDENSTEDRPSRPEEELEAAPVEFAAEVFANVTTLAERALAPRGVVEGTPMETEIAFEATSVDFREIDDPEILGDVEPRSEETSGSNGGIRIDVEEELVPNGQKSEHRKQSGRETSPEVAENGNRVRPKEPRRGSRSASPGMINRTTTPINAKSRRLPESYESLVTRGSNGSSSSSSSAAQQPRNRKYSVKTPKFVREATPGPDLDVTALQSHIQPSTGHEESIGMKTLKSELTGSRGEPARTTRFDDEAIATGVEAIESEVQRFSVSTTGSCSYTGDKRDPNASNVSNDDSGVESQRFSSDHPITDAVTEWLQRANSPELFVTSAMVSEDEPEDDELDDPEPSKNLEGNPMPALSANVSDAIDEESSRSAGCGKFATAIVTEDREKEARARKNRLVSRRGRRGDCGRGSRKASRKDRLAVAEKEARDDFSSRRCSERISKIVAGDDRVCELTENDSVAGMRVAESSRMTSIDGGTTESRRVEGSRRSRSRDGSTVENVEVKVRRMPDENDEGIVEDEEVSVRTFEKGEIVVSIEGKVLPVAVYEPTLCRSRDDDDGFDEAAEKPTFGRITCERSRREEGATSEEGASKRNSLGSIEEPDVLECWEVETVEPVTTPKRIAARGTEQEGEAAEDDPRPEVDRAGVEIVRKYYRLEATRDSGASVTSVEDCEPGDARSAEKSARSESPERMIESLCSEEIPVVGERMSKIVENFFNESGIPVEEAAEVYESCYNGKSYVVGLETKLRHTGRIFGHDADTESAVPCKAACCNIQ